LGSLYCYIVTELYNNRTNINSFSTVDELPLAPPDPVLGYQMKPSFTRDKGKSSPRPLRNKKPFTLPKRNTSSECTQPCRGERVSSRSNLACSAAPSILEGHLQPVQTGNPNPAVAGRLRAFFTYPKDEALCIPKKQKNC
jgi:hypothetical protein